MDSKKIALEICKAIDAKKGENISLLGLEGISLLTDYFVICSGNSRVQTQAIADHIEKEMGKVGVLLERREGYAEGRWILQDYGVVIVHIFLEEERQFYNLERLWGDASVVHYGDDVEWF
ncbi:MAG TPA: ribosome silencing factor [Clostridia bacterium]|nr:ribosome silencing factor [Clostridia bacterium]